MSVKGTVSQCASIYETLLENYNRNEYITLPLPQQ